MCLVIFFLCGHRSLARKKGKERRKRKNGGWRLERADSNDGTSLSSGTPEDVCPFTTLDAKRMTTNELFERCFLPQTPCIITGAMDHWPALRTKRWERSKFKKLYGDIRVPIGSRSEIPLADGLLSHTAMKLGRFLDASAESSKQGTHFDSFVFAFAPAIDKANKGNKTLEKQFQAFLDDVPSLSKELLNFFPDGSLPRDFEDQRIFSLGGTGGGIDYHYHGETLFALVHGIKVWYIYHPAAMPNRVSKKLDLLTTNWKNVSWNDPTLKGDERPFRCQQMPGTLLYLPQLFNHATENNGEAIGVGWQLDTQVNGALQTAKEVLKQNPKNPLALHTQNWFTYTKDPIKWFELYQLNPNDLVYAEMTVSALCGENGNADMRRQAIDIVNAWEERLLTLSQNASNNHDAVPTQVNIGTLVSSIAKLVKMMHSFGDCLRPAKPLQADTELTLLKRAVEELGITEEVEDMVKTLRAEGRLKRIMDLITASQSLDTARADKMFAELRHLYPSYNLPGGKDSSAREAEDIPAKKDPLIDSMENGWDRFDALFDPSEPNMEIVVED